MVLFNPCLNLMYSARAMLTPTMFSRRRAGRRLLRHGAGALGEDLHAEDHPGYQGGLEETNISTVQQEHANYISTSCTAI